MTLFGTSIHGTDCAPTLTSLAPQMVRIYDDLFKLKTITAKGIPVAFSMQTWDADKAASVLKTLPKGSTLSIKHEPEDDVASRTLTTATWRDWQLKLVDAIKKSGRAGEVYAATILMAWTLDPHSGRKWSDYLTPDVVSALKSIPGSIIGWDSYVGPNQGADNGPTVTAADIYGDGVAVSTSLGLRHGIFETGIRINPKASVQQAAWWKTAFAYLRTKNSYCLLLWNSPSNDPTDTSFSFCIDDVPALVKVWHDASVTPTTSTTPPPPPAPTYTQAQLNAAVSAATAPLQAQIGALTSELGDEHAHSAQLEVELDQVNQDLVAAHDLATQAASDAQAALAAVQADLAAARAQAQSDAAYAAAALSKAQTDAATALAQVQTQAAAALAAAQASATSHLTLLSGQSAAALLKCENTVGSYLVFAPSRRAKVLKVMADTRAAVAAMLA